MQHSTRLSYIKIGQRVFVETGSDGILSGRITEVVRDGPSLRWFTILWYHKEYPCPQTYWGNDLSMVENNIILGCNEVQHKENIPQNIPSMF